ncbi:nucleotidyltransferase-like protein [Kribbella voronezhensis]|uniref:Nucleotidyltransferase-like protein n=2 Tax=Kribbella voronezhensis TaxID=2512212 RepID=A0A4R7TH43_9ACTN|nr:nucleotidyltransferase-like protein [Kribbella voronezhensis]
MDAPVLAILARTTKPLTGRQIHLLAASGSESGTRRVLRRLSTTGLVTATEVGPSTQYLLNREHLAADAVIELVDLRGKLIDRMRETIDHDWTEKPLTASLFGSVARGDGGMGSDIDLLVVRPVDEIHPHWEQQVGSLSEWVHRWTGNHLQVYDVSRAELLAHFAADEPIVNDWLRDCITVYGQDFRQLRNRLMRRGTEQ